jgi:hypothetical protein
VLKGDATPSVEIRPSARFTVERDEERDEGFAKRAREPSSTDGGVNWSIIWPPEKDDTWNGLVEFNFSTHVTMDPFDHTHLLIEFHSACQKGHSSLCFGGSTDSGATWTVVETIPDMHLVHGNWLAFVDSTTWAFVTDSLWITTNSGDTWSEAYTGASNVAVSGQIARTPNGFYIGETAGIVRSEDGVTWTLLEDSGWQVSGFATDGTTIYAGTAGGIGGEVDQLFLTSGVEDGVDWTPKGPITELVPAASSWIRTTSSSTRTTIRRGCGA